MASTSMHACCVTPKRRCTLRNTEPRPCFLGSASAMPGTMRRSDPGIPRTSRECWASCTRSWNPASATVPEIAGRRPGSANMFGNTSWDGALALLSDIVGCAISDLVACGDSGFVPWILACAAEDTAIGRVAAGDRDGTHRTVNCTSCICAAVPAVSSGVAGISSAISTTQWHAIATAKARIRRTDTRAYAGSIPLLHRDNPILYGPIAPKQSAAARRPYRSPKVLVREKRDAPALTSATGRKRTLVGHIQRIIEGQEAPAFQVLIGSSCSVVTVVTVLVLRMHPCALISVPADQRATAKT